MKLNTVTYVEKKNFRNFHLIHPTCSWGKHTPRKCHHCTFMGTLLEFGASIRISLRYIHKLSICSCKPNKMFSHHLRLSSLNFPNYCRLKISCRLYKRRLCSASDVLFVFSLVSSSAYLTRLLSPAFLSGLLQLLSF